MAEHDERAEPKAPPLHPSIAAILPWFDYEHLSPELQVVSMSFYGLAHDLARRFSGPETTTALRKLLEAKDAAVRAAIGEKIPTTG